MVYNVYLCSVQQGMCNKKKAYGVYLAGPSCKEVAIEDIPTLLALAK